jgi:hypothetical protein
MTLVSMSLLGLGLVAASSLSVLLGRMWRWIMVAYIVQSLGVFLLVGQSWPLSLAFIKLVVGWMSAAVLSASLTNQRSVLVERSWPAGRLFRLLAAGLVILLALSIATGITAWLPKSVTLPVVQGSMILIVMGLLQMGMTADPLRVILGLLTVIGGFEILYAAVENSVLVAGLLAAVNLGLALVGAFFLTTHEEAA